ncbi:MAG: molybdopterin dehydrogenase FAD-binding protein [Actinomycetia bacterium]|nr:molybdopterin dehydrogenase FAD-binding protein [Actinomycetes bacterium]
MRRFEYLRPLDRARAVDLAANPEVKLLGGGTNLIDLMKIGVETPEILVDTTRLGLDEIESRVDGSLRIGASVRNTDVASDRRVRARFPVLSAAVLAGASGQLRNMATVGGNLLQRTRCAYFQDVTKACNKRKPGSGCPAQTGANRELAILGGSEHCIATHPSDMAVALRALDASVLVETEKGAQTIPLADFYRLPGDRPDIETNLPYGALIVAIDVPAPVDGARSSYMKVRDRASFGFALASVAGVLRVADGRVAHVALALGGVAPLPWRARIAEAHLMGAPADPDHFHAAIDAELQAAQPRPENAFKVTLARRMVVRVLTELVGRGEVGVAPS